MFDRSMRDRDPEQKYSNASRLAACGHPELGIRLLRTAVEQDYCVPYAIRTDPLLDKVRSLPGYPAILRSAVDCQTQFIEYRRMPRWTIGDTSGCKACWVLRLQLVLKPEIVISSTSVGWKTRASSPT